MPIDPITDWVRARGSVTFAEFMDRCLHDPEVGYYASQVPGPRGDFETAPTLSPLFGRCLARCVEAMWVGLERPDPLTVTEIGGGDGSLARSVAASSIPEIALAWRFVERHAAVAEAQRQAMSGRRASWFGSPADAGPGAGVVLANEVVDSFPVHLLEVAEDGVREAYVSASADGLSWIWGEPSDSRLADGLPDTPGRYEARPASGPWLREVAAIVDRGYLVVIDYGDPRPQIWEGRPEGTLLAYRDGHPSPDLLALPGRQDLTAHVDFTVLDEAAEDAGLRRVWAGTQRDFLLTWGLRRDLEELRARAERATGAEALRLHAARGAAAVLAGSMGGFRVHVWGRDVPDPDPAHVED